MAARILIIEDNLANMDLMVYLLQAYGHQPLQSTDGERGLAMALRERPDLIICDVHLPKMDGYAVVQALKADAAVKHIPVVAVTALAMVGDREKLLSAGFDAYLSKPIEPEHFIGQVESFLNPEKHSTGMPQASADEKDASAAVVELRSARILVVDDTAVNSELIRSTLAPFGYRLTLASGTQEALDIARQAEFDLILSDLHMPDQDGFALLAAVKEDPQLTGIPFVFLSSSFGSVADFRRGVELGATYFIRRPIEPQKLLGHIEACLNGPQQRGHDGDHPDR